MVELLVAMALFIISVTIASGGFIRALKTQKAIVALIAANDNASLSIEQMAREIRTGSDFSLNGEDLTFLNVYNTQVTYRLNNSTNAIEKSEGGNNFRPITAANVKINSLKFYLFGQSSGDNYSPRITITSNISPDIPAIQNISANLQTTVSARMLDT